MKLVNSEWLRKEENVPSSQRMTNKQFLLLRKLLSKNDFHSYIELRKKKISKQEASFIITYLLDSLKQ